MGIEVIVTCAVTGAGDTVTRSDKVPVTPAAIAAACIEAAPLRLRVTPNPSRMKLRLV